MYLADFLEIGVLLAIGAVIVSSVALFITDGIKAKKEHRKRKTGIVVYFVVVMALTAIGAIMLGFLMALAAVALRSM